MPITMEQTDEQKIREQPKTTAVGKRILVVGGGDEI
jgi:NADPH-dependent glutamate synthase beta subunit-like oxidoreductase